MDTDIQTHDPFVASPGDSTPSDAETHTGLPVELTAEPDPQRVRSYSLEGIMRRSPAQLAQDFQDCRLRLDPSDDRIRLSNSKGIIIATFHRDDEPSLE